MGRRARQPHLRRHERDHEGADRPLDGALISSLANSLLCGAILPLRRGRAIQDAEQAQRVVAAGALRPGRYAPPGLIDRHLRVSVRHHAGWPVYELAPRRGEGREPPREVVYLHGGAYVSEIVRWHWSFLAQLVRRTPATATVPIYPLGAALGAERTVATAVEIAREVIARRGADRVVLMGDSAGAGMALAVAQALRDEGVRPARIVLISPWLDIAVDQPEQPALARRDPMLTIPLLVEAGRVYRGELPAADPRVSPLLGDLRDLPPITAFTSGRDLLAPDSHRLLARCRAAGTACELLDHPHLPHAYPLLLTPEGRTARDRIVRTIRA